MDTDKMDTDKTDTDKMDTDKIDTYKPAINILNKKYSTESPGIIKCEGNYANYASSNYYSSESCETEYCENQNPTNNVNPCLVDDLNTPNTLQNKKKCGCLCYEKNYEYCLGVSIIGDCKYFLYQTQEKLSCKFAKQLRDIGIIIPIDNIVSVIKLQIDNRSNCKNIIPLWYYDGIREDIQYIRTDNNGCDIYIETRISGTVFINDPNNINNPTSTTSDNGSDLIFSINIKKLLKIINKHYSKKKVGIIDAINYIVQLSGAQGNTVNIMNNDTCLSKIIVTGSFINTITAQRIFPPLLYDNNTNQIPSTFDMICNDNSNFVSGFLIFIDKKGLPKLQSTISSSNKNIKNIQNIRNYSTSATIDSITLSKHGYIILSGQSNGTFLIEKSNNQQTKSFFLNSDKCKTNTWIAYYDVTLCKIISATVISTDSSFRILQIITKYLSEKKEIAYLAGTDNRTKVSILKIELIITNRKLKNCGKYHSSSSISNIYSSSEYSSNSEYSSSSEDSSNSEYSSSSSSENSSGSKDSSSSHDSSKSDYYNFEDSSNSYYSSDSKTSSYYTDLSNSFYSSNNIYDKKSQNKKSKKKNGKKKNSKEKCKKYNNKVLKYCELCNINIHTNLPCESYPYINIISEEKYIDVIAKIFVYGKVKIETKKENIYVDTSLSINSLILCISDNCCISDKYVIPCVIPSKNILINNTNTPNSERMGWVVICDSRQITELRTIAVFTSI